MTTFMVAKMNSMWREMSSENQHVRECAEYIFTRIRQRIEDAGGAVRFNGYEFEIGGAHNE